MTWVSIKESLISRMKNPNSTDSIKKELDNIVIKDSFSTFTNDKERKPIST